MNGGESFANYDIIHKYTKNDLLKLRRKEFHILKDRYRRSFTEIDNRWTFKLTLKSFDNISNSKARGTYNIQNNFVIDFYLSPKYPFVAPLVLMKPNNIVESPVNLLVSKWLFQAAQKFCTSTRPSIHVLNLIENIDAIKKLFERKEKFIYPELSKQENEYLLKKYNDVNLPEIVKKDQTIVYEYLQRMALPEYKKMQSKRSRLPAWKQKQDILVSIRKNQLIILKGETGCGKSTQVPQFIFDEWIESFQSNKKHCEIICTQPRRLSALGVANRVADERIEKVGHTVGYQIRFDHCISENTRLTFCTMGVLLNRIQREPNLDSVTHIIVDEVHERSAEG